MPETTTIDVHPGLFEGDKLQVTLKKPGERSYSFDIATDTKPEKPGGRVVINVRIAYWDNKRAYVLSMNREEIQLTGNFESRMTELFAHGVPAQALETRVTRYAAKRLAYWYALAPTMPGFANQLRELINKCNLDVPGFEHRLAACRESREAAA